MEFSNIKKGENVLYWSSRRKFPTTRTVIKVTKFHFVLDNDFKFRQKDGSPVDDFLKCYVTKLN